MRVLIPQATQNAAVIASALQKRGHHGLTIPVVTVERTEKPLIKLEGAQGFIVTSPDGARALADTIGVRTFPVFADSLTTGSELERLGFKSVKSAKDDSSDLAKLIEKNANPNHGAFIYACSTAAPVQLSALLSNMGFAVRSVPLYSVKRVDQIPPELTKILTTGVDAALFLSAHEARAFVALIQLNQLNDEAKKLKVVAANPVVAAPLRALKFKAVVVPDSGDLESVFASLDKKLIDKVEEERLQREQEAQEAAARERVKKERQAKEAAEKERLEREEATAREIEGARLAAERAEYERLKQEEAENRRLEKAEQKRIAKEKAEQEKRARQEAKAERLALAKAEKVRRAEEKEERKRVAKETAAREKIEHEREIEKRKAEDAASRKKEQAKTLERARIEKEMRKQQEVEQERKKKEEEARKKQELGTQRQREAEDAKQKRLQIEAAERFRQEELQKKQEEAKREEQERFETEKKLRDQQKLDAEQKHRKEKAAINETQRKTILQDGLEHDQSGSEISKPGKNTEIEDVGVVSSTGKESFAANTASVAEPKAESSVEDQKPTARAQSTRGGITTKIKSWFGGTRSPERSTPMFSRFQGERESQVGPDSNIKDSNAPNTPSGHRHKTTTTQQSPIQTMDQSERQSPKETQNVPQDKSQDLHESAGEKDSGTSESPSPTPVPKSKRSGGRAERLRAEDAADQQAQRQLYKNFDLADSSAEKQTSDAEHRPSAQSENSGGAARIVTLFIVLVVVATGIFATASWWVPQANQLLRSAGPPEASTVSEPSEPAPSPTTEASSTQTSSASREPNATDAVGADQLASLRKEFADRLDSIEQREGIDDSSVTSLSDTISSQARQLAAVSARLATLEAAIGNAARLEDLNDRITILEGKSADAASVLTLSERVANLEDVSRRAVAEQTAEVALLMATTQLREALAAGRPFSSELEATKALSERVLDLAFNDAEFISYATRGIPSLSDLQDQFEVTAAQTVRAAAIPEGASGWIRQSLDRIMSVITIRRASGGVAGSSASAILARAESRLDAGDLSGVIAELEALSGAAAEAAGPWLSYARARDAADQEIATTTNKVLALMALGERTVTPATTTAESE